VHVDSITMRLLAVTLEPQLILHLLKMKMKRNFCIYRKWNVSVSYTVGDISVPVLELMNLSD